MPTISSLFAAYLIVVSSMLACLALASVGWHLAALVKAG
jgi:hypothetical protein